MSDHHLPLPLDPVEGAHPLHPLEECVRTIQAAIAKVADTQATFLPTDAKARALEGLARIESQVAALRLRIMPTAEDVAAHGALRDVPAWLAGAVMADLAPTRAEHRLALALDQRFPHVARGMVDGRVSLEQAKVIVAAVDALPKRIGIDLRAAAEETLVQGAEKFRPSELRVLGRRILAVVAPEIAEEEDARKLDEEERHARAKARLRIRHLDNGISRISGLIPTPAAKRLQTYLDAYTSPRHHPDPQQAQPEDPEPEQSGPESEKPAEPEPEQPEEPKEPEAPKESAEEPGWTIPGGTTTQDPGPFGAGPDTTVMPDGAVLIGRHGEGDRIPYERKLAHAFCALLEHLDPAKLPAHGGDATTVLVTIDLEALRRELAAGGIVEPDLAHGPNLSAAQVRRLACQANIIPTVLGGHGEILDLGRSRRLFSPAQRKAIRLRDKRCRAKGCRVKAQWTEIHHLKAWANGGTTDLTNGVCLCPWHHHRIEDPAYEHEIFPDGDILITKRRQRP